jgi:hypothetical protein
VDIKNEIRRSIIAEEYATAGLIEMMLGLREPTGYGPTRQVLVNGFVYPDNLKAELLRYYERGIRRGLRLADEARKAKRRKSGH